MYLRYLKPETEQYLHILAMRLHGNRKGNLNKTLEDIVDFLQKGLGENDLLNYLQVRSQIPSNIANPMNLDFLYKG